jgi:ABC-2 type transport system permease protein
MSIAGNLSKLVAFFHRDFAIARGYRGALVLETFEALFGVATYYYLSRFVQSPELTQALPAGSNYFAFALVGFAFFDYLNVSIDAFDTSLNEAMQNRTLEALLVTQTPLPLILAGSAIYPFVTLALRTCVYLAWAALLFGFAPRSANWPGAAAVLLASVLAFAGLGILSASYQILFKRGNPAKWIVLGVSGLLGGMMYPISVLPRPLCSMARDGIGLVLLFWRYLPLPRFSFPSLFRSSHGPSIELGSPELSRIFKRSTPPLLRRRSL